MSDSLLTLWRNVCLAKLGSQEETPFGPDVLVYKVAGKMFALLQVNSPISINLKCDPQEALIIRASFNEVTAGYHMNKKHWNTVELESGLDPALVKGWIDDSYRLVVAGLPKKTQARLSAAKS